MIATQQTSPRVITGMDVREHFQETVSAAIANQKLEAQGETAYYLVNLLDHFAKSENLFALTESGPSLQPLALLYADAAQAKGLDARQQILRRLGDIALLIAGVFPGYLNRKSVDVDYYIAMGASAFSYLAETAQNSVRLRVLKDIYSELSEKFTAFVDVLAEVAENSQLNPPGDVLRLYEVWARTGSARTAGKLRKLGIEPVSCVGFGRIN